MEAYPLTWPAGWKRLSSNVYRSRAAFKTSLTVARDELMNELKLIGASDIILSTNVALRRDGLPYAGMAQPSDPGVAVYFKTRRYANFQSIVESKVIACDKWNKVEDNIQAVRLTVNAMRGMARWGCSEVLDRVFTGFAALPPPVAAKRAWHEVLSIRLDATPGEIQCARNILAKRFHPDSGSEPNSARMAEVNEAFAEAIKQELK